MSKHTYTAANSSTAEALMVDAADGQCVCRLHEVLYCAAALYPSFEINCQQQMVTKF